MSIRNLAEQAHVVNIIPPVDINGGKNSAFFHLKGNAHANIIIQLGVTGGTSVVTIEASDDDSGSSVEDIAFAIYKEETADGDTLGVRTAVASTGFTTSANDGVFYVIPIDAAQLPDGKPFLRVKMATPGASVIASAVAVLTGTREQQEITPTALA